MKILLPPGIGDIYWSLVKLRALLRKTGETEKPDVYIGTRPDEFGSHNRAWPFLDRIPFVNSTGEMRDVDIRTPRYWEHAYTQSTTGIFPGVLGCDYFVVYNGPINAGVALSDVDPELECEWDLHLEESLVQSSSMFMSQVEYGRYIVYHFGTRGTYRYWTNEFNVERIIEAMNLITDRTSTTPILVGGIWDREDEGLHKILSQTDCVDLMGKTSLDEVYGLIQGAQAVVGFPSGLSILSPALGTPTVSFWSGFYPEGTWWNVVPPETHGRLYRAVATLGLSVESFSGAVEEMIHA